MRLSQYLTEWLDVIKPLQRGSTFESTSGYILRNLNPYFDGIAAELETLTPMQVQGYINSKINGGRLDGKPGGLSPVTIRKHVSILKQALNDAVLYGSIPRNPAQAVKLPRVKSKLSKRTVFIEPEEAQQLITSLRHKPDLQLAVMITLLYGLRRSEVLGLRWQSIDFERNTFVIEHTVVKNTSIHAEDDTKTENSAATYKLLPEVREALLKRQQQSDSAYVFSRPDGSVMRPDTLYRQFTRHLKRQGFPPMRFHDLRHSTASILFAREWSLEDVKNWLRHTDIETTSNIYLHYKASRRILVGQDLAGVFHIK